uniref:Golgi to ER traffic protein 4 n=1 Tax=Arcella intermedia TaxID=1963864 RepID=A0A6B2LCG3_9EUKA
MQNTLVQGATIMLEHGQANAGTELALLLIDHYKAIDAPLNQETLSVVLLIFSRYTMEFSTQLRSFIKAAVNWSSRKENNDQGAPELHNAFAKFYDEKGHFSYAQMHYLRGTEEEAYAEMLVKWTQSGYPLEKELFITRAVLQYLCLSSIDSAHKVLTYFVKKMNYPSFPDELPPLINFLKFLLAAIKTKNKNLFTQLRAVYTISINRDSTFGEYLDIIAKNQLGIEPPKTAGGGLFKLVQSLFQQ